MVGAGPDPVSTLDHGRCQGYPPRLPPSTTTGAYYTIPQAFLTLLVHSITADAILKDDAGGSHAFHVPHSCPAYCLLLFARPTHAAERALIPFLSASYPSSPSFLFPSYFNTHKGRKKKSKQCSGPGRRPLIRCLPHGWYWLWSSSVLSSSLDVSSIRYHITIGGRLNLLWLFFLLRQIHTT